ncbi:MAG: hypothetical protein R3B13_15550 [Polyangiaceae bacterium]
MTFASTIPAATRVDAPAESTHLQHYIRLLPEGLNSYPDCQIKASIYRTYLADGTVPIQAAALPRELADLVNEPRAMTQWIPAVHSLAITIAYRDLCGDDETFAAFVAQRARRMYSSKAYRVLMAAASPAQLIRLSSVRWHRFHRGFELEVFGVSARSAQIQIEFPEHLYLPDHLVGMAAAMSSAVELSGGRDVRSAIGATTPTRAVIELFWR